jgi:5-methylcytosine-specific restriction endonuclease McrA
MSSIKSSKNTSHWLKYGKRHKSKISRDIRVYIVDLKSKTPCKDCGKVFHPVAMDFDHVHGKKKFSIGSSNMSSWQSVLNEISKCEIVCSNCHRVRTLMRKLNGQDQQAEVDDQLHLEFN